MKNEGDVEVKNKVVLFIIICILLSVSTIFADSCLKTIDVYYNDIKIDIMGESVDVKDKCFIYENKAYAPIRDIIEQIGGQVDWDDSTHTIKIKNYTDFDECDYMDGEGFVYGLVIGLDFEKKVIRIEQHFDDNSMEVTPLLSVRDDCTIIMQRNDKKINIELKDLKVGDDVGIILDKNNEIRGIVIQF